MMETAQVVADTQSLWGQVKPFIDYVLLPVVAYILHEVRMLAKAMVHVRVDVAVMKDRLGISSHS